MTLKDLLKYRLCHQQITHHLFNSPAEVVAWMGALQAQDYAGAKWSVGLRLPGLTDAAVEQAIADGHIVRTWPMRGTLHFVAAADVRWMLKLLTPRIIAGSAGRHRQLELDDKIFTRSKKIFARALRDGKQVARHGMYALLEHAGISTAGQRGIYILQRLSQEGFLCFAGHQGKQPAFALLDEWVKPGKNPAPEEALAELTLRYFTSHGPATLYDFAWWSGLKISDVKRGLEMVASKLTEITLNNIIYWMPGEDIFPSGRAPGVFLLPGFDEYMLGYKDRSAALDPLYAQKIVPGNNGMFLPTILVNGKVAGTWKRTIKKERVMIEPKLFMPLGKAKEQAINTAAKCYAKFMQKKII